MLCAVVADFVQLDGCRVVTTWDRRLGSFPVPQVDVRTVSHPEAERVLFHELAAGSDATFVIAPETAGLLARRCRWVAARGGRWLGCTAEAIELCADKLRLAEHLRRHDIPTIVTRCWDRADTAAALPYPVVIKPRDGAGSQATFQVDAADQRDAARRAFDTADAGETIWQPFIGGRTLSAVALVGDGSEAVEVFPIAEQRLSDDGRFRYLGGRVPARTGGDERIAPLIRRACAAVPGLSGYVGFDLIVSHDGGPLLVEINPRLTTSYLGYRALAQENLAARFLRPEHSRPPVRWKSTAVEFRPDGRCAAEGADLPPGDRGSERQGPAMTETGSDSRRPPQSTADRRFLVRYLSKAGARVVRDSDALRVGIEGRLRNLSAAGLGLELPVSLAIKEAVKVELENDVQHVRKEVRGFVRHITPLECGGFFIGIELLSRLTPLEVALLKMSIPADSADGPRWV